MEEEYFTQHWLFNSNPIKIGQRYRTDKEMNMLIDDNNKDMWLEKTEKYHQTLQEIKEILSQAMDVKSNAYNHFSKVEQAIDLITKAEEE